MMILYDLSGVEQFYPLALSRPLSELYYGMMNNHKRAELFSREHPEIKDIRVNSLFMGFKALETLSCLEHNAAVHDSNGTLFAVAGDGSKKIRSGIPLVFRGIWEMMSENPRMLKEDFEHLGVTGYFAAEGAKIEEHVFIDIKNGPVYIDKSAKVNAFSRIEGPSYIGENAQILGAKIRSGSSVFNDSRAGGEIEQSILYPYCNKYHEGFVGHSIFGSFTNLGALTTTSDLKNTYGQINVIQRGKTAGTGSSKIGTFCGDHSKLGIGTLLNSGTVIGFSSNLFGGGFFRKEYPSFYWGGPEKGIVYDLEKAMETAITVLKRRNIEFNGEDAEIFRNIYNNK